MLATSILMDEFDLILSPSRWGKDCLMNHGVPYELREIDCPKWIKDFPQSDNHYGHWASIDPKVLANILLDASRKNYSVQALKASEILRNEFSWERAGEKLLKLLFKMPANG
jgi:hypothetical protein